MMYVKHKEIYFVGFAIYAVADIKSSHNVPSF